ncbi:MAG: sugar ABC transporter substrate-binding protein [Acidimicrobiia bacterium]
MLLILAACGGSEVAETTTTAQVEEGGTIVAFIPTTTNTYIAEWARGAQDEAARLGYELTIIENNFDQAEQDTQVQQQLGAGDPDVVAYAWWPSDNEAGVASLQALAATDVAVIQTNQLPFPGAEQYVVGYAGVDDRLNGEVAAQLVVEARDWMLDNGVALHSEGGNAIIIGFVAGYQAGIDRSAAARPVLEAAGIQILDELAVGFGPQEGYDGTKQLIAAHRSAGIDLVYVHNSALAEGVVQALEEEGFTPGVEDGDPARPGDVMVVGGTCHGNLEYLEDGREYATGLQAARLEGVFSIATLHEYLTNGSLAEFNNFIPNPPVRSPLYTDTNELESVTVEGFTVEELCVY